MRKSLSLIVLIFFLSAVLFTGCSAKESPEAESEPLYDPEMYICLAAGSDKAILPDGDTSPLTVTGNSALDIRLVPSEVIALLGGTVTDDSVSVGPVSLEGEAYDFNPDEPDSLDFFRRTLGLCCDVYGDFVRIGYSPNLLDAEKRASVREILGCAGLSLPEIPVSEKETIIDPHIRVSYDVLVEQCNLLAEEYPELVSVFYPAKSVEERKIPVITLGRGSRAIFYSASIHASEFITTNILINMVDRYAAGYYSDSREPGYISFRELLDNVTFYIVPQINPDGVNIAQNGYHASESYPVWTYSRQGLGYASTYKANVRGVDLNRNFPYKWDPMKENGITWPCTKYFCGYEAASEPETVLMINLGQSIPWEMFADFHKFGETLYWIDSDSSDHRERYGHVAERILDDSGYDDAGTENIEGFGGYCSNYMRNVYDRFSCTVETNLYYDWNEKQFEKIDINIWRIGLVMGEELMKMNDQAEGFQYFMNGRRILVESDEADGMYERGITYPTFERLCEYCNVEIDLFIDKESQDVVSSYGEPAVLFSAMTLSEIPEGNLAVKTGKDTWIDGTLLLTQAGIGCELLDNSVYILFDK